MLGTCDSNKKVTFFGWDMWTEGENGVGGDKAMELRFKHVYLVKVVDIIEDVFREQNLVKKEKKLS